MVFLKLEPHIWTSENVELLKKEYKPNTNTIRYLSQKIGCSYGAVKNKAGKLKLTRNNRKTWSIEEEEKLCDLISMYNVATVAKKMQRSEESIKTRLSELKKSTLTKDGWYSGVEVAMILGVERRWVYNRIKRGAIKATNHYDSKNHEDFIKTWHIEKKDLVDFIKKYPSELQGLKPDMVMFIDLLTNKE